MKQKGYDIAIKAASILKKRKINFAWYAIGGGRDENENGGGTRLFTSSPSMSL